MPSFTSTQGMPSLTCTQGMPSLTCTQGMQSPASTQGMPSPASTQGMPSLTCTQGMQSPASTQGMPSPASTQGMPSPASTQGTPTTPALELRETQGAAEDGAGPAPVPVQEIPRLSGAVPEQATAVSSTGEHNRPGPSGMSVQKSMLKSFRKKKRNNSLDFLREYCDRQEKRQKEAEAREEQRQRRHEDQVSKMLDLFGRLVDKM
ncbi:hypothetical protein NHX12_029562 [Muraenolepis orangiensis]|uniref:Uncharacterized protein n=1 Tax=Muraenolepis orangiensis TaxID=630683 RepID=A0A9Q0IL07_9TELE|nr:hypothetical protein NHX12_029562 [Muraenolepis orangiensis]